MGARAAKGGAMMTSVLQVALGGALGASARYLSGVAVLRLAGPGFPWATLMVNVVGSFAMGVALVAMAHGGNRFAPFVMTGFLGGFTTFSAFSLDAYSLIERGQTAAAVGYMAGSVALALGGLVAGIWAARAVI